MTQEQIAQRIEVFARRLAMIMTSTANAHNYEKQMLISDLRKLVTMLKFT